MRMRKIILVSFFAILGFTVNAQKKAIPGPFKHVVKFNPPMFLFSTMNLSYEYRPDVAKSFQLSGGITYKSRANDYYSVKDYVEGYTGELQIRLYPLAEEGTDKNLYNNFYVAPYMQYKYYIIKNLFKDSYDNNVQVYSTDRFSAYSLGILTGINNVVNKRFHIDIYIGGGIRLADTKKFNDNIFDYGFKGIAPRIGFDLGINF
jgi:hypothetical protein